MLMVCDACNGTGCDAKKTAKARKTGQCDRLSYIRCWNCVGNGVTNYPDYSKHADFAKVRT